MRHRFFVLFLLYMSGALSGLEQAIADKAALIEFDIKKRPIAKAIKEFAKHANVAISIPPLSYKDGQSMPLKGSYSLHSGLTELLRNSSLAFDILSPKAIRIYKVKKKAPKVAVDIAAPLPVVVGPALPEEIIISARHRKESITSLPASATVFSPTSEGQFGLYNTQNVSRKIAGAHNIQQLPGQNKLVLRGLSDGAFNGRAQTLVSTYVDDVRIIYNAPDPGLRLVDVERVEVLKGPQGTLSGSGALSGLYRIVTNKPDLEKFDLQLASSVSFVRDGGVSHDHTGIINLPIITDKLSLRAVGLLRRTSGYIDNIRLDQANTNDSKNIAARTALAYRIDDNWQVNLGFNFQDFRSDDTSYFIENLGPLNRDNNFLEPYSDEFLNPTITILGDLGWGQIKSSTAYINRKIDSILDASTTVERQFPGQGQTGFFSTEQNIDAVSNETLISSHPGGRLEWLLGAFFSYRNEDVVSELLVSEPEAGDSFLGIAGPPNNAIFFEGRIDQLNELAFFGEASYFFTEKLVFTAGIRWFKFDGDAISLVRAFAAEDTLGLRGSQDDNSFLPKFAVSYHHSDDLTFYGQISVGRRLGGTNLLGSSRVFAQNDVFVEAEDLLDNFASDKLLNYEIGLKHRSADGDFAANATLFYSKWEDIQSYQFSPDGLPDIANVGDAFVTGFEADFLLRAKKNHRISANIAWNVSEITRTENQFGAQVGDRLPGAPPFTVGVNTQHDFYISGQLLSLNLDYNFVDEAQLLFQQGIAPQSDSYHLVGLRFDLPLDPFNISIFVNNLFDTQANIFPFANPFNLTITETEISSPQVTPLTPRTIGISANWQF